MNKPISNIDYKAAYVRQKLAREKAEFLLESRSSELYEMHESLILAYTKLKEQKTQLFHQEKLASIGQLSAGVAHEINNPAGYVKSNLNSLQRYLVNISQAIKEFKALAHGESNTEFDVQKIVKQYDLDYILADIDELVSESIEGMQRIESIVKSLKNFARPDQDEIVPFNINECIEDTLKLVSKEIAQKATLKMNLGSTQLVEGQPGSISQVILNLLVNATQAMTQNGVIEITTIDNNSSVVLKVRDNGLGISKENLPKIFDPFFTTKEIGVGTGLGLSVSHGIIKKHKGSMTVSSEDGVGSEFSFTLPAV